MMAGAVAGSLLFDVICIMQWPELEAWCWRSCADPLTTIIIIIIIIIIIVVVITVVHQQ
jgi:hypothetical protein